MEGNSKWFLGSNGKIGMKRNEATAGRIPVRAHIVLSVKSAPTVNSLGENPAPFALLLNNE
jgi:hypothetical protein